MDSNGMKRSPRPRTVGGGDLSVRLYGIGALAIFRSHPLNFNATSLMMLDAPTQTDSVSLTESQ
ncbi:hypothetical protein PC116_g23228 [Phytophthora cactorum]|uniref:Uncharacterized protein n=1 Tax=Phytophthora cactorum TaxID=29920 RepID=A0A8T1B0K5_9STRA|nr:hypothetical protein Pcac1_g843 [Phytophthora cactorum]KAG2803367.1 hypothetical protein PC112_g19202 [Phytophthora cactorum]KAG2804061.1 hypothetical protein PC111_g18422 [Phytophthora cactorum]KAG2855596.1 hypothetical protein PC113_g12307 [Phytophthora cactorum]KAG2892630.1 hypothetical protein PC115_g18741 [Phytophthora cactorum]